MIYIVIHPCILLHSVGVTSLKLEVWAVRSQACLLRQSWKEWLPGIHLTRMFLQVWLCLWTGIFLWIFFLISQKYISVHFRSMILIRDGSIWVYGKKKKSAILLLGPTLEPAWKRHHIYHPFTKCQDPDLDFSRKILCEVKGIQQWRVSTSGPEKTLSLIHSLWLSQVYYAAFYYIFLQTVNNIPLKLSLQHGT